MKKMSKKLLLCLGFCCLLQSLKAQDSTENDAPEKSHWETGLSYLNNSVYLGRQDSLKVPYLTPSLGYYNKSGFYITGTLSYLKSNRESRIDLFEIEAGYDLTINKFDGEISVAKDFYNSQSKNVKSETKGDANMSLSYDFGFIKPSLQGGITLSKIDDYSAGFCLEHSFFALDDNLEMDPSFLINASTQNYYGSYYSKRRYSGKRKKLTGPGTIINAYLPNASEFKIMDYEWSIPLNYSCGNFIFNFTPTLAIPVNPNIVELTVVPPTGASYKKSRTEKLSDVFFWSAGITYSF